MTTLQCRSGAVEVALSSPSDAVRVVKGSPVTWTLKRNPRTFCGACGTRLFIEVAPLKIRGVSGTLLPAGTFQASFHMQCNFAVLPVRDGLPHYKGRPPQFGGSDETVDW
jgi:hypothetical protein